MSLPWPMAAAIHLSGSMRLADKASSLGSRSCADTCTWAGGTALSVSIACARRTATISRLNACEIARAASILSSICLPAGRTTGPGTRGRARLDLALDRRLDDCHHVLDARLVGPGLRFALQELLRIDLAGVEHRATGLQVEGCRLRPLVQLDQRLPADLHLPFGPQELDVGRELQGALAKYRLARRKPRRHQVVAQIEGDHHGERAGECNDRQGPPQQVGTRSRAIRALCGVMCHAVSLVVRRRYRPLSS